MADTSIQQPVEIVQIDILDQWHPWEISKVFKFSLRGSSEGPITEEDMMAT